MDVSLAVLLLTLALLLVPDPGEAAINGVERMEGGGTRVTVYFFWSLRCPHCQRALPFVESLERDHPWIEVEEYELTGDRSNVVRYVEMADSIGEDARAVPAFFVCGRMLTGYDSPDGIGREVLRAARFRLDAAAVHSTSESGREGAAVHVDLGRPQAH
jgi:hypothetical protein